MAKGGVVQRALGVRWKPLGRRSKIEPSRLAPPVTTRRECTDRGAEGHDEMAHGRKTGGRTKGTPNRLTSELRDLMLGALDDLGGREWVVERARERPELMFQMLGRLLPRDVKLDAERDVTIKVVTGVPQRGSVAGESP